MKHIHYKLIMVSILPLAEVVVRAETSVLPQAETKDTHDARMDNNHFNTEIF